MNSTVYLHYCNFVFLAIPHSQNCIAHMKVDETSLLCCGLETLAMIWLKY